jgi:hypothetical protein
MKVRALGWPKRRRFRPRRLERTEPLIVTIALAAAAAVPAAPPRLVHCRMMECRWERRVSNEVERTTPRGQLRKYVVSAGTSVYRTNRPPSAYSRAIRIAWEPRPKASYIFCSRSQPALAFQSDDGRWIAHALDLFSLPGYHTTSAIIYTRACHGLDFDFANSERRLRRLGYRPGTRSGQIEIKSPFQLVDLPPDPRR